MKSIEAAADTGGLTRREALLASGSAGAALGGLVVDSGRPSCSAGAERAAAVVGAPHAHPA